MLDGQRAVASIWSARYLLVVVLILALAFNIIGWKALIAFAWASGTWQVLKFGARLWREA